MSTAIAERPTKKTTEQPAGTPAEPTAGQILASGMRVSCPHAEEHGKTLEQFNADADAHGEASDKIDADSEALIVAAETLDFAEFKKRTNALASARLRLFQDRLKLWRRREDLLQALSSEMADRIKACRQAIEDDKERIADGLREAGSGPENSQAWARGATNQAQREFDERVRTTYSVVALEKEWKDAVDVRANIHPHNRWRSRHEIQEELRDFVLASTNRRIS